MNENVESGPSFIQLSRVELSGNPVRFSIPFGHCERELSPFQSDIQDRQAAHIVTEMGEGLDEGTERDARRDRRFGETVRNVSRALLSKLWHNKGKIAKGFKEARVGAWAGGTALYGFAKFLVSHVDWVHTTLAGSPGMLQLADKLIASCKLLPF